MENCILIDKQKKISHWQGEDFETKIYNNSGILEPKTAGFIRYSIFDAKNERIDITPFLKARTAKDKIPIIRLFIKKTGYMQLNQIFISPEFRQKGFGTVLMNDLIKLAKRHGKPKIIIINASDIGDPMYDFCLAMKFKRDKPRIWERKI